MRYTVYEAGAGEVSVEADEDGGVCLSFEEPQQFVYLDKQNWNEFIKAIAYLEDGRVTNGR